MKRVVICGSREFNDYDIAEAFIKECMNMEEIQDDIIIVSGASRGADLLGERFARENGYMIERYKADWRRYGRGAGTIRNKEMANVADFVICFWDKKSKGTRSMIDFALKKNRKVYIKYIDAR